MPLVVSEDKFDPMVAVVDLDEFDRLLCWSIKVVSCVGMSWSLIVKVNVCFDVRWEIVLLSPEDLYELVAKSSVLDGCHDGNSSVFQELVGKPNLC